VKQLGVGCGLGPAEFKQTVWIVPAWFARFITNNFVV
jgi:hypothetical protein